jgi:hypothetical protein
MRDDFDFDDVRENEDGTSEYLVDGEWRTDEDLDYQKEEDEYWEEWSDALDDLDEGGDGGEFF